MRNEDQDSGRRETEGGRTYAQQQSSPGASSSNDPYPSNSGSMTDHDRDRSRLVTGGPIESSVDRTTIDPPGAFNPPTPPELLFSIRHSDRLPIPTTRSDREVMAETRSGSRAPIGSNRNPSLGDDLRASGDSSLPSTVVSFDEVSLRLGLSLDSLGRVVDVWMDS